MKVLMLNGSPHKEGCTDTALREVTASLEKNGIETEIFHLGTDPISGCIACGGQDIGEMRDEGRSKRICGKGKAGGRFCFRFAGLLCQCFRADSFFFGSRFLLRVCRFFRKTGSGGCQLPARVRPLLWTS